jgi:hydroxymethylbilane synthase
MLYKVGTRDSKLAIIQAQLVCQHLVESNSNLSIEQFELVKIKTLGDKVLNKNLIEIGGKNLFIKEIEEALLKNQIDFAVHSLKDMTANLDSRLVIASCLPREDPRDAFLSMKFKKLSDLPQNSLVGTSSVRRGAMLLHYRPDIKITSFRGNVLTRLEKLEQGLVDGTFLAVAGLKRLGIDESLYQALEIEEFLPAISQGVIGVECRKNDHNIIKLLRSINHRDTEIAVQAERGFLEAMQADCNAPIAAYARLDSGEIELDCLIIDGQNKLHKMKIKGDEKEAHNLGYQAGLELKVFL